MKPKKLLVLMFLAFGVFAFGQDAETDKAKAFFEKLTGTWVTNNSESTFKGFPFEPVSNKVIIEKLEHGIGIEVTYYRKVKIATAEEISSSGGGVCAYNESTQEIFGMGWSKPDNYAGYEKGAFEEDKLVVTGED